jgi:hypothetical protein
MTDQLALFAENVPSAGTFEGPTTSAKGPRGLLLALIEAGLDECAVEAAAALVLVLDEGGER